MNFLAFILSVYILILTAMPCVDVNKECALQKAELTQTTNQNHHNDIDCCSPFCTCDCCATHVIQKENVIHFDFTTIPQKCVTEYTSFYISSTYASIWHPPKMSS